MLVLLKTILLTKCVLSLMRTKVRKQLTINILKVMETTIKNWTISLNDSKTELIFTNGYSVCYAYYDMKKDVLFFDRIIAPKYAINYAKKWAKENGMIDIYNS